MLTLVGGERLARIDPLGKLAPFVATGIARVVGIERDPFTLGLGANPPFQTRPRPSSPVPHRRAERHAAQAVVASVPTDTAHRAPARNPNGPPLTPDGRYIVVRGRLWRAADPSLSPERRQALVDALMAARRAVRQALKSQVASDLADARAQVQAAKVALGERGPVWWDDGAPDLNRRLVASTPYAKWWARLDQT